MADINGVEIYVKSGVFAQQGGPVLAEALDEFCEETGTMMHEVGRAARCGGSLRSFDELKGIEGITKDKAYITDSVEEAAEWDSLNGKAILATRGANPCGDFFHTRICTELDGKYQMVRKLHMYTHI